MSKPLLFVDTETTGLGKCRMIEYAQVSEKGNPIVFRVRPPVPIEIGAMAVHHILERDVADLSLFSEMPEYDMVSKHVEDNILVAHHAYFDMDVLEREGIEVHTFIDTKEMAQQLYPEAQQHTLQYMRYYLGLFDIEGVAHSAAGDVSVLRAVFNAMCGDRRDAMIERFTRTR